MTLIPTLQINLITDVKTFLFTNNGGIKVYLLIFNVKIRKKKDLKDDLIMDSVDCFII